MRPPDDVGRCSACPLTAPLWSGLCLHCTLRCRTCSGQGRVLVIYRHQRMGWPPVIERRCQACDGSGRDRWAA